MIHERLNTCAVCRRWAATSEKQWGRRQINIRNYPLVDFAICPSCKTSNWALTRELIVEEPVRSHRLSALSAEAWVAIALVTAILVIAITLLMFVRSP